MQHLPQGLGLLGIEGPVNDVRAAGFLPERLFEAPFVELVDGVSHGLGVASQRAGDLVGVLAPFAGEKYLATAQGEGIRRAQSRLQGLTLGVREGTHKDRSFHILEDKP